MRFGSFGVITRKAVAGVPYRGGDTWLTSGKGCYRSMEYVEYLGLGLGVIICNRDFVQVVAAVPWRRTLGGWLFQQTAATVQGSLRFNLAVNTLKSYIQLGSSFAVRSRLGLGLGAV